MQSEEVKQETSSNHKEHTSSVVSKDNSSEQKNDGNLLNVLSDVFGGKSGKFPWITVLAGALLVVTIGSVITITVLIRKKK